MVRMILVNMQNFKLLAFYFLRYDVTKISLRTSYRNSKSSKTWEKSLLTLENIFPGTNLYLPLHLHGFEAKQSIPYSVRLFETSHFKNI